MRTGKCKLKLIDPSIPLSEQLQLKKLTIADVGEGVEQLDHSYISYGNNKQYNTHLRKHFGDLL